MGPKRCQNTEPPTVQDVRGKSGRVMTYLVRYALITPRTLYTRHRNSLWEGRYPHPMPASLASSSRPPPTRHRPSVCTCLIISEEMAITIGEQKGKPSHRRSPSSPRSLLELTLMSVDAVTDSFGVGVKDGIEWRQKLRHVDS